jgi:hypothetical protein
VLLGECGWCCSACTPSDGPETLPEGAKEYLHRIKTAKAEEMPDPGESEASRVLTRLLRNRLQNETGRLRSYDILFSLREGG